MNPLTLRTNELYGSTGTNTPKNTDYKIDEIVKQSIADRKKIKAEPFCIRCNRPEFKCICH